MGSNAPGMPFKRAHTSSTAARSAALSEDGGSTLIGMTRRGGLLLMAGLVLVSLGFAKQTIITQQSAPFATQAPTNDAPEKPQILGTRKSFLLHIVAQ
jgi:hypothetical protein